MTIGVVRASKRSHHIFLHYDLPRELRSQLFSNYFWSKGNASLTFSPFECGESVSCEEGKEALEVGVTAIPKFQRNGVIIVSLVHSILNNADSGP